MPNALPFPLDDERPLSQAEILRGLLSGICRAKKRQKQPVPEDIRQALCRLGTTPERAIDELYSYQRERTRRWHEENT